MPRTEILVDAEPEVVFDVLTDAETYADWVVGSREIRDADSDWPEPGTVLHHTVGLGPFALADHTLVEESLPPVRLRLLARARPLPSARITIDLRPEADGTRLTMVEDVALPFGSLLMGPVGHGMLRLRNVESLRRLKELAERVPAASRS